MEQEQHQNTSLFNLSLDAQNSYSLRSAASWAKVLGVVGLILGGLCIILGIMVQQVASNYGEFSRYERGGLSGNALGGIGLAVYGLIGIIFIVSSIFALNAGNKINAGLKANDQGLLNAGFAGVRNYFAIWAIIIIIMLLFTLLGVMGNLGR